MGKLGGRRGRRRLFRLCCREDSKRFSSERRRLQLRRLSRLRREIGERRLLRLRREIGERRLSRRGDPAEIRSNKDKTDAPRRLTLKTIVFIAKLKNN